MAYHRPIARCLPLCLALSGLGCTGAISDMTTDEESGSTMPGSTMSGSTMPGSTMMPGSTPPSMPAMPPAGAPATTLPVPASCTLTPRRMVKLTPSQITNSLEALIPGARGDVGNLSSTVASGGEEYSNSGRRLEMPESHVESLMTAAEKMAARAMQNMSVLASCLPAGINDDTCVRTFISELGARAFRRPLDSTETDAYWAYFAQEARTDRRKGVRLVLQALLLSPHSLFRSELGSGTGASVALTPHERASALSYLLTDGPPDSTLSLAANRGELATKAQVEAQARRLLSAKATGLLQFFKETLRTDDILDVSKDTKLFPLFTGSVPSAMAREPMAFIEQLLWKEGASFSKLYSADWSMVNSSLGKVYGVSTPSNSSSTFEKVMMPAGKRAGLMTQAGRLAQIAKAGLVDREDVIRRGLYIRERVLCQDLPPVNVPPIPQAKGVTTREHLEMITGSAECQACHSRMNPLGFALQNYDAIGAWRDTEAGRPVDARGFINGVEGGDRTFANAVEMGRVLSDLPEAQQCFAGQLWTYASGQSQMDLDECRTRQVMGAFKNANGNILDTVAAIVAADDFLIRASAK